MAGYKKSWGGNSPTRQKTQIGGGSTFATGFFFPMVKNILSFNSLSADLCTITLNNPHISNAKKKKIPRRDGKLRPRLNHCKGKYTHIDTG